MLSKGRGRGFLGSIGNLIFIVGILGSLIRMVKTTSLPSHFLGRRKAADSLELHNKLRPEKGLGVVVMIVLWLAGAWLFFQLANWTAGPQWSLSIVAQVMLLIGGIGAGVITVVTKNEPVSVASIVAQSTSWGPQLLGPLAVLAHAAVDVIIDGDLPFGFHLAALVAATLGFVVAGTTHARESAAEYRVRSAFGEAGGILEVAFGMSLRSLEGPDGGRVRVTKESFELIETPAKVRPKFEEVEVTLTKAEVEWMMSPASSPDHMVFVEADQETLDGRELMRKTDYMIRRWDFESGTGLLSDHVGLKQLEALFLHLARDGYLLVDHQTTVAPRTFAARVATVEQISLIQSIASEMRLPVYDWHMDFEYAVGEDGITERIDVIRVHKAPIRGIDREVKKAQYLDIVMGLIPGGSNGWSVEIEAGQPTVLRWGPELRLPGTILTADMVLALDTSVDRWRFIPQGVDIRGEQIIGDLIRVPHELVAGETNSGKSKYLLHSFIVRRYGGHKIVILDGDKNAIDFAELKEHTLMWGETITEVANALKTMLLETQRRRMVRKRFKVGSFYKIPEDVRIAEGIIPTTIFIDEYESTVTTDPLPKLPKDDPEYIEAEREQLAIAHIKVLMKKLVKKARSEGIFLVTATQTPYAEAIDSSLRANLGSKLQLAAADVIPAQSVVTLTMGKDASAAVEQFQLFADGELPMGVKANRGKVQALRTYYIEESDAPAMLDELGVEKEHSPWLIPDLLKLGIERTEDEDETRVHVDPPFMISGGEPASTMLDVEDDDADGDELLEEIKVLAESGGKPAIDLSEEKGTKLSDRVSRWSQMQEPAPLAVSSDESEAGDDAEDNLDGIAL